ncbi:hypothetical protein ABEW34_11875 [Paenibacillus algorifonticola]|uniref:hypothetical protein n=1 Tax=Paenibacillus algorifonticola TaxID=684063 RepID=UPI003D28ED77
MTDRIVLSVFFLVVFGGFGVLNILYTEFMIRTTSSFKNQKKATKAMIKRFKISGYITVVFSVIMVIITLIGGLKGI